MKFQIMSTPEHTNGGAALMTAENAKEAEMLIAMRAMLDVGPVEVKQHLQEQV